MYQPPKDYAKETVKEIWKLSTKPRYQAPPKTKQYFIVPKKPKKTKKKNG